MLEITAIVLLAGLFTGWFGLGSTNPGGGALGTGPDLNPHGEAVNGVYLSIQYSGNSTGYFVVRPSGNLCTGCPMVPALDDRFGTPLVSLFVYFNLTNSGTEYHELSGWNLTDPGYSGADPFSLRAVLCCAPLYGESSALVGAAPGQTVPLAFYFTAEEVPANGGDGFSLDVSATTSG